MLSVDRGTRQVLFMGGSREPGDPYFQSLYRLSLDDGEPVLLTPESAHHRVDFGILLEAEQRLSRHMAGQLQGKA